MKHSAQAFSYIEEREDIYANLWPHRYDYIWAAHSEPGEKPQWQTETRHPLSDRLMLQGAYLYGVRFGPYSRYVMLDIDAGSLYHPSRDSQAILRIRSALEDLGLTDGVACTSSYSGGLHLYFPFAEAQRTWQIALAVATVLENKGFKLMPGQLEVFPNPRNYAPEKEISLYQAHRLPLQAGSYLLNDRLEPIYSSAERFVDLWQRAQAKNTLTTDLVARTLKACQRRHYRVTTRAEKFLNDLNAEIEVGWTGPGMTNRLLGRIAMRSYVFGHILYSPVPLVGQALIDDIVRTARDLPGFYEWSRHVHELEAKAREWARAVEKSHYFHYGTKQTLSSQGDQPSMLQDEQRRASREKICRAIATLLEEGILPAKATARFELLTRRFHIGGKTLYKYKDLWHPNHLLETHLPEESPEENSPDFLGSVGPERSGGALQPTASPSLLAVERCNDCSAEGFGASDGAKNQATGCNPRGGAASERRPEDDIREMLISTKARLDRSRAQVARHQAECYAARLAAAKAELVQRMKAYLQSGDAVLIGEALNWLQAHPEYQNQVL